MNHLYPTTGIPTHAIHPFTRLPWDAPGLAHLVAAHPLPL